MGLTEVLGLSVSVQFEATWTAHYPAIFWECMCQGYQAPATCPTLFKWEVTMASSLSFQHLPHLLQFFARSLLNFIC